MLWGQLIKVYTDHKILVQDALGLTSYIVYHWRLLLEEYGREIIHIKDIQNTVADAISHLDYSLTPSDGENWMTFILCWCNFASQTTSQQPAVHQDSINLVSANRSEEHVIYPLTVQEIAEAQQNDLLFQLWRYDETFTRHLVENTQILCKDTAMVLPTALQHQAISWYHHDLQHPGAT